jgi:hypothetical protein
LSSVASRQAVMLSAISTASAAPMSLRFQSIATWSMREARQRVRG